MATVTDLQIPGDHNILNALAVIAVSKLEDIPNALIRQGLRTYNGMPYRIQKIAEEGGRVFYNDSKATNTTATKTALHSFQQPITYIGGGLDRGVDFMDLRDDLQHVRQAYLYGESKELMAHAFRTAGVPAVVLFDTLKEAATAAYQSALSGEVVLFSPACASWDQYQNYEVRGEEFTLVIQHCIEEE